jgi:putative nucleotidyltransferase with HDIG domain
LVPLETSAFCDRIQRWLQRAKEHEVGLYQHSILVGDLSLRFARHLGHPSLYCEQLYRAALLHDMGKLAIPAAVLTKATPLSLEEMRLIYAHPDEGHKLLLAEGGHDELTLTVARDHHERLDGSGYPRGIKASRIAEAVRIVTICDVFAAMTEERPYGETFTPQGAIDRMWAKKASRLDMRLVRQFEAMTIRLKPVDLPGWSKRWTEKLFRRTGR